MLRLASCVVTSYIMSSSHAATSSLLASNACGARKSYSSPRPTSSQTTRSSLSASRRVRCAEVFFFGDPDGPVRSGRVAHSARVRFCVTPSSLGWPLFYRVCRPRVLVHVCREGDCSGCHIETLRLWCVSRHRAHVCSHGQGKDQRAPCRHHFSG